MLAFGVVLVVRSQSPAAAATGVGGLGGALVGILARAGLLVGVRARPARLRFALAALGGVALGVAALAVAAGAAGVATLNHRCLGEGEKEHEEENKALDHRAVSDFLIL